jgi:hypothetical protein
VRSAVSALCGLVAAVLLPVALVAVWLHAVVADRDAYLARVDPLAGEQRVRGAVQDVLVDQLLARVDLTALGAALQSAADTPGLDLSSALPVVPELPGDLDDRLRQLREEAGPLLDRAATDAPGAAEELVHRVVAAVVGSDAFAMLWRAAQRAAHREVVAVLDSPAPVQAGARFVVPLDVFVGAVQEQVAGLGLGLGQQLGQQLEGSADGFSLALPLPAADHLASISLTYRVLVHTWLLFPVAAVVLAAGCLVLARRRRRTLARLGVLAALGCVGLLLLTALGRRLLLHGSPSGSARLLAGWTADAVTADLRHAAVVGVLVGVGVLVLAALLGLLARGGQARRRTVGD